MSQEPKNSGTSQATSDNTSSEENNNSTGGLDRRRFLQTAGAGLVSMALLGLTPACTQPPTDGDGGNPDGKTPTDPQDKVDPTTFDKAKALTKDPASIKEGKTLFPLTVQAGILTSSSAWVWGYTTDDKPKTLRIWREDSDKKLYEAVHKKLTPAEGYFKHKVEPLAPGTWYFYGFFDGENQRSAIGRFRTALVEGSKKPLTIAATACTKFGNMPYTSMSTTADFDYDMFLHLGDFSYNDPARNKKDYRELWRRTLADPGYKAALSKAGMYVTWDDHEIINNDKWDTISKQHYKDGVDSFFEHTITERIEGDRFWNSYVWGDTAEIFVLDCRSERKYETRKTDDPIYISKEQMAWFKKALSESKAHFKIVMNSVPITDWTGTAMASISADDRWQGYPKQREEILKHITDNKISNVWWITGDFHLSTVNKIDAEGPYSSMYEIMVGPGGNGNPLWPIYQAQPQVARDEQFPPDRFPFFGGDYSATLMTFDPIDNSVRVKFVHHKTKKVLFDQKISQKKA